MSFRAGAIGLRGLASESDPFVLLGLKSQTGIKKALAIGSEPWA